MGDFRVTAITNDFERRTFYKQAVRDLEAFQLMLEEGLIEKKSSTIGAEQELCIIDKEGNPAKVAPFVLKHISTPNYTNELSLFNLEINLDPQPLKNKCFSIVEKELQVFLQKGNSWAHQKDAELFLAGILPTIRYRDLKYESMTPEPRYKILSEELLNLRGRAFEIYLQGVDDFYTKLQTVLFEACNTSFQTHLQINPDEFVNQFNWAQMIAGPVLSVAANSPILFGKELWAENRIGLFKQSLDTRSHNHVYSRMARVYFGNKWLTTSPLDIWKEDLIRFPMIFQAKGLKDPVEEIENGIMPSLKAIRLHNGTTYTWNRLCYGVHNNQAHIRLECRYLPAGPTLVDEVANFAFWVGLMKGVDGENSELWKKTDFQEAKSNFIRAARTGIETVFNWKGKCLTSEELIIGELLPIAYKGLHKLKVDTEDINKYLGIIEHRVLLKSNGANWAISRFRDLKKSYKIPLACELLTLEMLDIQKDNIPIHECQEPNYKTLKPRKVEDLMQSDIYRVNEDMPLSIARRIMKWKNINHLPVENNKGDLVGIISKSSFTEAKNEDTKIKETMHTLLISCGPDCSLEDAIKKMRIHSIQSLLIIEDEHLVGILTTNDLKSYLENPIELV